MLASPSHGHASVTALPGPQRSSGSALASLGASLELSCLPYATGMMHLCCMLHCMAAQVLKLANCLTAWRLMNE